MKRELRIKNVGLALALAQSGMTLTALSEITKISRVTLSKIYNQRVPNPKAENRRRICEALNVPEFVIFPKGVRS